jgi:hypothetical protein
MNLFLEILSMKSKQRVVLITFGVMALLSYWIVSLWILSPAFEASTASHLLSSCWIFVISTFLLFITLSAWSVLIMRCSKPFSVLSLGRERLASAFKYIAVAVFSQLILWFRVMLTMILEVALPTVELWFVAAALAWMTTPFATLGWMYIGSRLGSWLEGKGYC